MASKKKTSAKKAAPKKKTSPVRKSTGAKAKKAAPKAKSAKRPSGKKTGAKSSSKAAPRKRPTLKSKRPSLKSKSTKRPAPRAKLAPLVHIPNPEAHALAQRIAGVAVEKKALDVMIIDTQRRASSVGYDYIIVATGESDRQLTAVADGVRELLKPQGTNAIGVEASADWVMMDYGSVVAHLFTADRRGLTDFEGMWSDAPRVPVKS